MVRVWSLTDTRVWRGVVEGEGDGGSEFRSGGIGGSGLNGVDKGTGQDKERRRRPGGCTGDAAESVTWRRAKSLVSLRCGGETAPLRGGRGGVWRCGIKEGPWRAQSVALRCRNSKRRRRANNRTSTAPRSSLVYSRVVHLYLCPPRVEACFGEVPRGGGRCPLEHSAWCESSVIPQVPCERLAVRADAHWDVPSPSVGAQGCSARRVNSPLPCLSAVHMALLPMAWLRCADPARRARSVTLRVQTAWPLTDHRAGCGMESRRPWRGRVRS